MRMNAYYYSFEPTGIEEIDLILSAVACAGKASHHTDGWRTRIDCPPFDNESAQDYIQRAANNAAKIWKEK